MAKRKIPCPYCKGEVLATQNGRGTSSQALFPRLQNFLTSIGDLISALTGGQKTVSRKDALKGKCKTCGGSGQIEDATDTKDSDKAAADYLASVADKIEELNLKRGNSPGGNMLERISGVKVTLVGTTLNNAPSVTTHKGKGANPTSQEVKEKAAGIPQGPEKGKGTNVITGNNVPSNGGGLYYIQCGNKFKLTAGAQGIEIGSHGPISIDGSQVRLTGAEVTVGGSGGPTVIEGDHLQVNGKSIALTPSGQAGEVVIQGSASCSGNLKAGGGYIENMYCASLTMPSSQSSSKVAAGTTDYITGPAKWSGMSVGFTKLAVQNLIKWFQDSTTDINLAGSMSPINPRSILKNNNNMSNLIYAIQSIETTPTGICITAAGPGLVYNFPHAHALPDSPHTHDMTLPAISHDGNSTAEVVRQKFEAAGGNTKVPCGPTESGNPLVKLISGVVGAAKAVGGAFTALIDPYSNP
jgi:hypothetical protein